LREGYGLVDQGILVQFPQGISNFSFLQNVQISSVAPHRSPTEYGHEAFFHTSKVVKA